MYMLLPLMHCTMYALHEKVLQLPLILTQTVSDFTLQYVYITNSWLAQQWRWSKGERDCYTPHDNTDNNSSCNSSSASSVSTTAARTATSSSSSTANTSAGTATAGDSSTIQSHSTATGAATAGVTIDGGTHNNTNSSSSSSSNNINSSSNSSSSNSATTSSRYSEQYGDAMFPPIGRVIDIARCSDGSSKLHIARLFYPQDALQGLDPAVHGQAEVFELCTLAPAATLELPATGTAAGITAGAGATAVVDSGSVKLESATKVSSTTDKTVVAAPIMHVALDTA
jgi:hypothetical protein